MNINELIALREQETDRVKLTSSEANALERLHMDIRYREDFLFEVNPGSWIGHFRLNEDDQRALYIEPKVPIRNIFSLLGTAYHLYSQDPDHSLFRQPPVQYSADIADAIQPVVIEFNKAVTTLLQEGLLQKHIESEENLKVLRGRLLWPQHISQNLIRKDRLFCRFAQSEVDIPENQVVLWALLLLQRSGEWSVEVKQTLQSHILHFGGVSVRQFLPRQVPVFHYDRLSFRYADIHRWCRLFIDLMSLSHKRGDRRFSGYLLDMNDLFERYVAASFQRAARRVPAVRVEYHNRDSDSYCPTPYYLDTDGKVEIIPDVILRGPNSTAVVVDAKYKRAERNSDLYQIVAYCAGLELIGQELKHAQGILVYPKSECPRELEGELRIVTRKSRRSELTVKVIWLDLDSGTLVKQTHDQFENVLEALAR